MGKASERKKQQKREKQRRKREQHKREAQAKEQARALPTSERGLVELASKGEFGPAWIVEAWDDPTRLHEPIPVLITRRLRGALWLPHVVWAERSCRGVMHALVLPPTNEAGLLEMLADLAREDEPMLPCEVPVAQSVVLHAVGFAEGLELQPAAGFHMSMFEPRPEPLLETAGARPERPVYCPSRGDDVTAIIRHLDRVAGSGNYELVSPFGAFDMDALGGDMELPFELDFGPFEHDWHPADAGEDPARIDWRRACEGVPVEPPIFEVPDDAGAMLNGEQWWLHDVAEQFAAELESGRCEVWEALLRQEQGLPLTEQQRLCLGEMLGSAERIPLLDDRPRPCEPWYQALQYLLARLCERPEGDENQMIWVHYVAVRVLDAVAEHATRLSLPPGVDSLAELLAGERVSLVRARAIVDPLLGIGQAGDDGQPMSLADPKQRYRIEWIAKAMRAEAAHLERLGWGIEELLEHVSLAPEERRMLLEGLDE